MHNKIYYNRMRRNDLLLALVILLVAALLPAVRLMMGKESGAEAVVYVDGKETGRYPLSENADVIIEGAADLYNHLVIRDGAADIVEAQCPDQICVHQKAVSRSRETLVCLPNKVVVEIAGGGEGEVDAVVN